MNKTILIAICLAILLFTYLFQKLFIKEIEIIDQKFPDGSAKIISIYKQMFGNNKKVRELEFWEKNVLRYDKQFKNNVPYGLQIFYPKSGGKISQYIKNGQRDGIYTEKDSLGKIIKQEHWLNWKMINDQ